MLKNDKKSSTKNIIKILNEIKSLDASIDFLEKKGKENDNKIIRKK